MKEEKDYPTDEFGRANGRNYHYRIHMNDEKGMKQAAIDLKISDRFVTECDCCDFPHYGIETRDNKGHIAYLTEYSHSKQWENPFGPGRHEDLEIRYSNGGGTTVKGTVPMFDEYGHEYLLEVEFGIGATVGELKDAIDGKNSDVWEEFSSALSWAIDDALEAKREREFEQKRQCDHEHVVWDDDDTYLTLGHYDAKGYCEDCHAELTGNKELPY